MDCAGQSRCRACLNGPEDLADPALLVTAFDCPTTGHAFRAPLNPIAPVFTTLARHPLCLIIDLALELFELIENADEFAPERRN